MKRVLITLSVILLISAPAAEAGLLHSIAKGIAKPIELLLIPPYIIIDAIGHAVCHATEHFPYWWEG